MILRLTSTRRPLEVWLSDIVGGTGHHTQHRRAVELTLRSNDGHTGLGEASPLPRFSREELEEAEAELSRLTQFELEVPTAMADCRVAIEQSLAPFALRTASARYACEGALVDLLAHHFGVPAAFLVGQLLGAPPGAVPARNLEVSRLIPRADRQALLGAARSAWRRGYRTLKLKLGRVACFDEDLRQLGALREQLPEGLKLRLDPNGSWPSSELPRLLAALAALSPELLEEPAPAHDLLSLEHCPVDLGVDESLLDPGVLDELEPHLERLRMRAAIIKPALLGFFRAVDLAVQARTLGLDVIVTHLFDGPVGHATAVCLALAIGTATRAQGLAPHAGLLLCPERRILGLGGGHLVAASAPGLPLSGVTPC